MDTAAHHWIVAGVDGSTPALHATRWAAREAARRHAPLRLFNACVLPPDPLRPPSALPPSAVEALVDCGYRLLRQAEQAAHEAAPGIEIQLDVQVGPAAGQLIENSATARLVVLGSRGLGGFAGMLLGSVSSAVAAHGQCPVVVVRGRTLQDPPPQAGPVVVGVDGSPCSDAAVEFALDAASMRRVPLVAVHTWTDISMDAGRTSTVLAFAIDHETITQDEQRLLAERLTGWREKYPDVELRQRVLRDRPVRGLLGEAEDAQLLVVGSRGHTALKSVGIGSTSQALLHHSPCPVAVVR